MQVPQMGTFVVDKQVPEGCKPIGWQLHEFMNNQWFPLLPAELRNAQPPPIEAEQKPYPTEMDGMGEDFHDYILKMM